MELTTAALLLLAGLVSGVINAMVGSGTLITYPALLALGLSPVVANGTNTAGLCPGSVTSALGYRALLRGRMRRLAVPLVVVVLMAALGAWLVVALPESVFEGVVPWLILLAALMVAAQPRITRWLTGRRAQPAAAGDERVGQEPAAHSTAALSAGTAAVGLYGGYFGASQGVMFMAVLGVLYDPDIQRSNGAKNLLAAGANVTAMVVLGLAGRVDWAAAAAIAVGSFAGGFIGAGIGRRLPARALRAILVLVAVIAAVVLLVRQ